MNSRHQYFLIENFKENLSSNHFGIKIQIVLNNGFHMKAENIDLISIEKKEIRSFNKILE